MDKVKLLCEAYWLLRQKRIHPKESWNDLGNFIEYHLKFLKPLRHGRQVIPMSEEAKKVVGVLWPRLEVLLIANTSLTYEVPISADKSESRRFRSYELPRIIKEHGDDVKVRRPIQQYWDAIVQACKKWQVPRAARYCCRSGAVIHVSNANPYIFIGTRDGVIMGNPSSERFEERIKRLPDEVVETAKQLADEVAREVYSMERENDEVKDEIMRKIRIFRIKNAM